MACNKIIGILKHAPGADNALSKINTDYEIGPYTVTPFTSFRASSERSEGSVAMGSAMLRYAQHDSAVIHTDVRIILLICIIGPYTVTPFTSFRASSERSERSVAMGSAMLRCAQHDSDSAVTHMNAWIHLFMRIIGPYRWLE